MATAGYLISRAAERPAVLSLTVAIVFVRFFGLARPLSRYLERLASHDLALRVLGRAAGARLRAGRAAGARGAGGIPPRRPPLAARGGRRLAPEPAPARRRAAPRRPRRGRRLRRRRGCRAPARGARARRRSPHRRARRACGRERAR